MQVINFVLQTMDPGNTVMRKTCLQTSMATLKEVVRVFPMVIMNDSSTRLAIGDAITEINGASIRIYDMQRYKTFKGFCISSHHLYLVFLVVMCVIPIAV